MMSINPLPLQVITYIDNMSPEIADREERENDYILQREAFLDALREAGGGGGGGGGGVAFKRDIFPSATLNQTEFTLTATPALNSETVNVNGLIAYPGSNNDYVLSGDTITFNYGLELNDKVMVSYS
jgi:hypothetical protein